MSTCAPVYHVCINILYIPANYHLNLLTSAKPYALVINTIQTEMIRQQNWTLHPIV